MPETQAPAAASTEQALPPARERPTVIELTLGWPVEFITTRNQQGDATAYSALGYAFEAAFCPWQRGCLLGRSSTNLNADSGAALLSGTGFGVQAFLLGRADPAPEPRRAPAVGEMRPARIQSIWRLWGQGGFCRRDFDFTSLYGNDAGSQVFVGARPELVGSFWCAEAAVGADYLFRSGHRVGVGMTYYKSLKASISDLKVTGTAIVVRYQLLRF